MDARLRWAGVHNNPVELTRNEVPLQPATQYPFSFLNVLLNAFICPTTVAHKTANNRR